MENVTVDELLRTIMLFFKTEFGESKLICYSMNHLFSTILGGQHFVFLFRQPTEQPHQGDMDMDNSTSTSKR